MGDANIFPATTGLGAESPAISKAVACGEFGDGVDGMIPNSTCGVRGTTDIRVPDIGASNIDVPAIGPLANLGEKIVVAFPILGFPILMFLALAPWPISGK